LAGELSADLGLAVIRVTARTADVTLWERFNQLRLEATSPQVVIRMLNALGGAEDPALRSRTLAMLMDGSVRTQDSPYILLNMAGDRVNGPATWTALQANWAAYTETIPKSAVGRIVSGLAHRTEPGLPEDIAAFFVANPIPQAAKQVQQHLEQLRIHANLRAREGAKLSAIINDVLDAA
jgi:aminopeptidase N